MVDTGIDCESFFQNKINSILVTTSWVETLKDLIQVDAVSQIWGETPAWYLWFSDAQGAYRFQLEEALREEGIPMNRQGLFSIKCYPFPNQEVFKTFSYEEQLLCKSGFFDETQTPRFEEKEKISSELFDVAILKYRVNRDDTMSCFTLESLDTLRWLFAEETVLDFDLMKKIRTFEKGEIGRSVPGWLLGYPLFDRLLCMYAFYSKHRPVRVIIARSTGFEYLYSGNHAFECRHSGDAHKLSLSVYFAAAGKHHVDGRAMKDFPVPDEEHGQAEILLDYASPCGHFHLSEEAASPVEGASVNPLWWSLAETVYTSNLASTCGCH